MNHRRTAHRRPAAVGLPGPAVALLALLAAACGKKESGDRGPTAAAEVAPLPPPPTQGRPEPEDATTQPPDASTTAPRALPPESAGGGAALWITAPNLARSLERLAALLERLRAGGGDLAAQLPPAADLRAQAEMILRGALFGQLLGLADPSAVDLSQPLRLRLSFPSTGDPSVVVSLGTTRPLEPMRTGSLSGRTAPDGRYWIGLGVEPDTATPWPAGEPDATAEDLFVVVEARTALPALVRALGKLQNTTARLGGAEPLPPWLGDFMLQAVRFAVETVGIDRMIAGLSLPAAEADPPLRLRFGTRTDPASPLGAALAALGENPPPFAFLDALDAGPEMWLAVRLNPEAARRYMKLLAEPMERFVGEALAEEWRAGTLEILRAMTEVYDTFDGRVAIASRTRSDGRGAFSIVVGRTGDPAATRAALRRGFAAAASLLQAVSDKYSFGATITWTQAAARSGGAEVDRFTVVVPRASVGAAVAAALQPGTADLRWDISVAVAPSAAVLTTETDPAVLQRILAGRGQGGGAAAGSPLAARLANPEPGLAELGWLDFAASFRNNPALACPPGTTFPTLPIRITASFVPAGFDLSLDILPGGLGQVGAFAKAIQACTSQPPSAPAP